MWETSSVRCPQLFGHDDVVHDHLVDINFLVGVYLEAILIAHMSCHEGDFLVNYLRASQSTLGCDIS